MPLRSRHVSSVLPVLLVGLTGACGQILGLSDFTNECGGDLDQACTPGAGGGTASTTATGQGGSLPHACTPGTLKSCYSGPSGTETKGICHTGKQTCNADGTGYGACEGEQVPAATEDCSNMLDDDCNGQVNDGCLCVPGVDQKDCYDGPPDTEGKGICKGGKQTCAADGLSYGPCVGEVTPEAHDDCSTMLDEDCTGGVNESCSCTPGDSMACYDGPSSTAGIGDCKAGMAPCKSDGSGYDSCMGEVIPTTEDYDRPGDEDCNGFPTSDTLWAQNYGDSQAQHADAVVFDSMGNVFVSGTFNGVMQVGTHQLQTSNPRGAGFFVKLDSGGNVLFAQAFNDLDHTSLAVDASDHVILAGTLLTALDFGLGTQEPIGFVVVGFDNGGTPTWQTGCTDSVPIGDTHVAVGANGGVVLATTFRFPVNCGSGTKTPTNSNDTILVAKFNVSGAPTNTWTDAIGNATAGQSVTSVAIDASGTVWAVGATTGVVSFGTGFSTPNTTSSSPYLASFKNTTGAALTLTPISVLSGSATGVAVALDPLQSPLVLFAPGSAGDTFKLGDSVVRHNPTLGKYDTSGGFVFSHELGDMSSSLVASAMTLDDAGTGYVAGSFTGALDLGGGAKTAVGVDGFLWHFDATATHVYQKDYPTAGGNFNFATLSAVAAAPVTHDVALAGLIGGAGNLGANVMTSFDFTGVDTSGNAMVMFVSR